MNLDEGNRLIKEINTSKQDIVRLIQDHTRVQEFASLPYLIFRIYIVDFGCVLYLTSFIIC